MSTPDVPDDRPPSNGGGNLPDYFRSRYGPTPGLIVGLTVGGLGAIQLAKSEAGAWPVVALVCFAIVAAIYCAKNRIH
jgi:hypothetical protein